MAVGLARIVAMAVASASVPPALPVVVTDSTLGDELAVLLRSMGPLRGITLRGALPRRLMTPAQMRAEIEAVADKSDFPGERETQSLLLARLGLLPEGADYPALLAEAIAAKPTAFYDPLNRRLSIPAWIELPQQRAALAHELAHALADQRFGLRRTLGLDGKADNPRAADGARPADGDRRRARQALIEGDAATLSLELFDPRGALLSRRELAAMVQRLRAAAPTPVPGPAAGSPAPLLVRELQSFPTIEGLAFVGRVRSRQPWAAVDALWARPPDSTEQILHPEKYDRGEAPIAIETAPLGPLQSSHRLAATDTLGELMARLWLSRHVSAPVAERAAEGWGGDRVAVYLPNTAVPATSPPAPATGAVLAWLTVWDSAADAEDFADAAAIALAALADASSAPDDEESALAPSLTFRDADGKLFVLYRRAERVALLLGAPADALPAVEIMLSQWRSAAPPPAKGKPASPPKATNPKAPAPGAPPRPRR